MIIFNIPFGMNSFSYSKLSFSVNSTSILVQLTLVSTACFAISTIYPSVLPPINLLVSTPLHALIICSWWGPGGLFLKSGLVNVRWSPLLVVIEDKDNWGEEDNGEGEVGEEDKEEGEGGEDDGGDGDSDSPRKEGDKDGGDEWEAGLWYVTEGVDVGEEDERGLEGSLVDGATLLMLFKSFFLIDIGLVSLLGLVVLLSSVLICPSPFFSFIPPLIPVILSIANTIHIIHACLLLKESSNKQEKWFKCNLKCQTIDNITNKDLLSITEDDCSNIHGYMI